MSMNSFHARQGKPRPAAQGKGPADRHGLLRVDQLLVAQGLAASTVMLLTVGIIIIQWAIVEVGGKRRQ